MNVCTCLYIDLEYSVTTDDSLDTFIFKKTKYQTYEFGQMFTASQNIWCYRECDFGPMTFNGGVATQCNAAEIETKWSTTHHFFWLIYFLYFWFKKKKKQTSLDKCNLVALAWTMLFKLVKLAVVTGRPVYDVWPSWPVFKDTMWWKSSF